MAGLFAACQPKSPVVTSLGQLQGPGPVEHVEVVILGEKHANHVRKELDALQETQDLAQVYRQVRRIVQEANLGYDRMGLTDTDGIFAFPLQEDEPYYAFVMDSERVWLVPFVAKEGFSVSLTPRNCTRLELPDSAEATAVNP